MDAHDADAIDEKLNCTFVLASSLYFRLDAADPPASDPILWHRHGLLHETARDLAALSEGTELLPSQVAQGMRDLTHSLRDAADLALAISHPKLSHELRRYADRLETSIVR